MMGAYVIGHNIAGYLPEGDTHSFATFPEALEGFENMAREYADDADEINDALAEPDWSEDDYGTMRACVDSIIADRDHIAVDGNSAGMIVDDNHNRDISFWLRWEHTREPDTTE